MSFHSAPHVKTFNSDGVPCPSPSVACKKHFLATMDALVLLPVAEEQREAHLPVHLSSQGP